MFIVWGKKIVRTRIGFVGDFCPICRARRAFKLERIGSAGHVYYISLGEGDLVGYRRTCTECRMLFTAQIEHYAGRVNSYSSLDDLFRQTYPDYEVKRDARLQVERRIRVEPRSLDAEDRAALLREPFQILDANLENHFSQTQIDLPLLGTIVAIGLALFAVPTIGETLGVDDMALVWLPAVVIAMGVVIWQYMAGKGRYVRRVMLPLLVRTLQPLQPTDAELVGILALLKKQRVKLASYLKADRLKNEILVARPQSAIAR